MARDPSPFDDNLPSFTPLLPELGRAPLLPLPLFFGTTWIRPGLVSSSSGLRMCASSSSWECSESVASSLWGGRMTFSSGIEPLKCIGGEMVVSQYYNRMGGNREKGKPFYHRHPSSSSSSSSGGHKKL